MIGLLRDFFRSSSDLLLACLASGLCAFWHASLLAFVPSDMSRFWPLCLLTCLASGLCAFWYASLLASWPSGMPHLGVFMPRFWPLGLLVCPTSGLCASLWAFVPRFEPLCLHDFGARRLALRDFGARRLALRDK